MHLIEFVFGVSFCSGLFIFCSVCKHMLVTLLGLEFLVLSVFMVLLIYGVETSVYFIFVFLVFSVCEGLFSYIHSRFYNSKLW